MKTVVELAEKDEKIILLFGDIKQCMEEFEKKFPNRLFNMGVAEQTMVGVAAGLALEGLKPVVYTITPFIIKRALEQVSLDIDLQKVPVILAGWDKCYDTLGPTHSGKDAWAITKILKNTNCYFPLNSEETRKAVLDAYGKKGPAFISLKRDGA